MTNLPFQPLSFNLAGTLWEIERPQVMGILNVTPDSFYDGGRYESETALLRQCETMVTEGADLVDIGGYSSRPGAADVPLAEEKERVRKAIQAVRQQFPQLIISVDTFRAEVARLAVGEGANLVNDISAGHLDAAMLPTVAELKIPYIAMHMRGTPQTMKQLTKYDQLLHEILDYFAERLERCKTLGIHDVAIDPGFGFAKTVEQNYELFSQLEVLHHLQRPLLVGVSRKSMIWRVLNSTAEDALHGTTALHMLALQKGAHFLRVHDVKPAKDVIAIWEKLNHVSF